MGEQLPRARSPSASPDVVGITIVWAGLLLLTQQATQLPWQTHRNAPDGQHEPRSHSARGHAADTATKGIGTGKAVAVVGAAAGITLPAGR